jgi:hypothetical protein
MNWFIDNKCNVNKKKLMNYYLNSSLNLKKKGLLSGGYKTSQRIKKLMRYADKQKLPPCTACIKI